MAKLILIVGICQIVAGVIVIGLVSKNFHDVMTRNFLGQSTTTDVQKVRAFGPLLIGILVVVSGIFGILSELCSSAKMDVFYLLTATVASAASAASVWNYGLAYKEECTGPASGITCPEETKNILITLLAFSIISCAMSCLGMVSAALTTCRKL